MRRGWKSLLGLAFGLLLACGDSGQGEVGSLETSVAEKTPERALSVPEEVVLFFPGDSGLLYPEPRSASLPEQPEGRVQTVLTLLLEGPRSDGLFPSFGEGTRLGVVLVDQKSIAFVDLVSADESNPPASGSRMEMQQVYSVVNSVMANVEKVEGVVLLWNGRQRTSFAGHIDTGHVLRLNQSLIAAVP